MASKYELFQQRLKTDRIWFMRNFLKIRDKKSKLVPFEPNSAQLKFNAIIDEDTKNGKPKRYIILKARQLGMSTFTEGYIYHDTSNNELRNSLIIAHEDKATTNLFNMSKLFYEECPMAIRPMKKYSNGKELSFENPTANDEEKLVDPGLRSKITIATAGTADTGRSGTYHNIHVSEIAFFPDAKNTMTALMQCVPNEPNTFVCLESTANGIGGYFYDMWYAAVAGENDFTPIFFPWFEDPEYSMEFPTKRMRTNFIKEVDAVHLDEKGKEVHTDEWLLKEQFNLTYEQLYWRKWCIANNCGGDEDMFKQEYPATPDEAFISSGRPRFDLKAVKQYEMKAREPKIICDLLRVGSHITLNEHKKGNFKIWIPPEDGKYYVVGGDVAEGLATGDFSVATVMDDELNVVAKWRGHIDPDLFGDELVKIGMLYNGAYLAVENNNHGLTTLKSIANQEYYNLFYSKSYDKFNDTVSKKLGWSTNRKTKPIAIDRLAEYIREMFLGLWDMDIISELYSYIIEENGSTNAQEGKHDDCVMSLAIALQAFLEGKGEDYMPEISRDDELRVIKKGSFDVPEIIDELFESEEIESEYSI